MTIYQIFIHVIPLTFPLLSWRMKGNLIGIKRECIGHFTRKNGLFFMLFLYDNDYSIYTKKGGIICHLKIYRNKVYYLIIKVPVLPEKASTIRSIEVIRTLLPPCSIKRIAALIFGPIEPFGN